MHKNQPRQESNQALLARIKKEMDEPRMAESTREDYDVNHTTTLAESATIAAAAAIAANFGMTIRARRNASRSGRSAIFSRTACGSPDSAGIRLASKRSSAPIAE